VSDARAGQFLQGLKDPRHCPGIESAIAIKIVGRADCFSG